MRGPQPCHCGPAPYLCVSVGDVHRGDCPIPGRAGKVSAINGGGERASLPIVACQAAESLMGERPRPIPPDVLCRMVVRELLRIARLNILDMRADPGLLTRLKERLGKAPRAGFVYRREAPDVWTSVGRRAFDSPPHVYVLGPDGEVSYPPTLPAPRPDFYTVEHEGHVGIVLDTERKRSGG